MGRHILHCDFNAFYVSMETQRHPEFRNQPLAVCGSQEKRHGIVLTAKLGSDYRNPDAITRIEWDNYQEIVYSLPVEDLLYAGPATSRELRRIAETALALFQKNYSWEQPVRSIGVRGTDLVEAGASLQLSFYPDAVKREKWEWIDTTVDQLRSRYEYTSIRRALLLTDPLRHHKIRRTGGAWQIRHTTTPKGCPPGASCDSPNSPRQGGGDLPGRECSDKYLKK